MKALITGASSGIGLDMARVLHKMGAELWLVARRGKLLEKISKELDGKPHIIPLDISSEEGCHYLYNTLKDENIDILINNAGFGQFGYFSDIPLEREIQMIKLNICSLHILTKLFLRDFEKKNSGYILNVASSAAFIPGPLMSVYYSTKAYVLHLTEAISKEIKVKNKNVYIGALCPGPVDTGFNAEANVSFSLKGLSSQYVAEYAIKKMFKKKLVIIPGLKIRLGVFFQRLLPLKLLLKISYFIQKGKDKN